MPIKNQKSKLNLLNTISFQHWLSCISFLILIGSNYSIAADDSTDKSFETGIQIGRFTTGTIGLKNFIQYVNKHCSSQYPDKEPIFSQAMTAWKDKNAYIISNWRTTLENFFTQTGYPPSEIPAKLKLAEQTMEVLLPQIHLLEDAFDKQIRASSAEDQLKICTTFFEDVSNGKKDIKILSPNAMAFHDKYFPSNRIP